MISVKSKYPGCISLAFPSYNLPAFTGALTVGWLGAITAKCFSSVRIHCGSSDSSFGRSFLCWCCIQMIEAAIKCTNSQGRCGKVSV